uniref:Uncharacterized protein n=1 Tax=Favella ehrenbergii TaxID=182087 RepID=A0A7S3I008_9SPIT|mmetsp:Transcript_22829/g.28306  ORF Transcript_22829/g.28306 Transcript_22829/m.28306 type:complete len:141 (+) Transcript_22829:573-995(+)
MLGGLFCFTQLQIDSRIAGYGNFLIDPQLNLAKVLIAFFGFINTSIILIQIHCLYAGTKRQTMVHEDSSFEVDSNARLTEEGEGEVVFTSFNDGELLIADKKSNSNKRPLLSRHSSSRQLDTTNTNSGEKPQTTGSYFSP